MQCPLCLTNKSSLYHEADRQKYAKCSHCKLVFVLPEYFISHKEEKARYDLHVNDPEDQRYRHFLDQLFSPLSQRIAPHSTGLDFGSGPGPTLSLMFEEARHQMYIYDPFYAPDESVFEEKYDFITTTEVAEHLHHPREEFEKLWSCLQTGGVLGVMTKMLPDDEPFADWHYKEDPTHVCFYHRKSFEYLAREWNAEAEFFDDNVVIFRKSTMTV